MTVDLGEVKKLEPIFFPVTWLVSDYIVISARPIRVQGSDNV